MISSIKQKMAKDSEEGFTLIELMVVVLIIGILMAIAIPTFLSATSGAKKNAAEADLTSAALDEQTYITQNPTVGYGTPSSTPTIGSVDSGITWTAYTTGAKLPSTAGTHTVYVSVTGGASTPVVYLATLGQDGNAYWVEDNNGALTYDVNASNSDTALPSAISGTSWSAASTN